MDGGHIIEEASPKEFFSKPKEDRTRRFLARILSDDSYSVDYIL